MHPQFENLLEGKSFHEKCQLKLDHETVEILSHFKNGNRRTVAQISDATRLPAGLVKIFLKFNSKQVWKEVLSENTFCGWLDYFFDPSVGQSRRIRLNVRVKQLEAFSPIET